MSNTTDQTVGRTILAQMGGAGRIRMMIGAKRFVTHPDGVSFKFPNRARSKANFVKVTLTPLDTYTVEFKRVSNGRAGLKVKDLAEFSDVYFDQLIELFEGQTGLYLRF